MLASCRLEPKYDYAMLPLAESVPTIQVHSLCPVTYVSTQVKRSNLVPYAEDSSNQELNLTCLHATKIYAL